MSKKNNIKNELIFWMIFAIGVGIMITLIILYCCLIYHNVLENSAEAWVALIVGCISSTVTAELSYMAYWQNKRYKEQSDENNKRIEEENEKYRQQDLKIRANPRHNFVGIEEINYHCYTGVILDHDFENKVNFLTNLPFEKHCDYKRNLVFTFNFTVNENVEYIKITKASIGTLDEYGHCSDEKLFENVAHKEYKGNLLQDKNEYKNILLNLLWDKEEFLDEIISDDDRKKDDEYKAFFKLLERKDVKWSLKIYYEVGNSYGLVKSCRTIVNFENVSGLKSIEPNTEDILQSHKILFNTIGKPNTIIDSYEVKKKE